MSLIQCKDCGQGVSSEADYCPNCGKKLIKPLGCLGNTAIAFLCVIGGFVILAILGGIVEGTKHTDPAQEAATEKKWHILGAAAIGLRSQLRNPESLKFSDVIQMPDDTICIHYRAQNGFGGMNVSRAVGMGEAVGIPIVANEETDGEDFRTAWNNKCANKSGTDRLEDMNFVLQELDKKE
jgi:hypothetical protein